MRIRDKKQKERNQFTNLCRRIDMRVSLTHVISLPLAYEYVVWVLCWQAKENMHVCRQEIWFFEQFIVLCLLKLSLFFRTKRIEWNTRRLVNLFFKDYLKSLHQRHGKLGQVYDNLFCVFFVDNVKICQEIIRKASYNRETNTQYRIQLKEGNNIL